MQRSTNIGYHTRLRADNTKKVTGGSFGGDLDWATVERLVSRMFTVEVLPSGYPVFVDKQGRQVHLYFSVDAGRTNQGKAALAAWQAQKRKEEAQAEEQSRAQAEELEEAMAGLSHDEVIRRLKGDPA